MDNVFRKGMILGGMLGVLAVGAAMSKPGQEVVENVKSDVEALAKEVKRRLDALQDVTKSVFDQTVESVVSEYVEQKKIAMDAKDHLVGTFESLWSRMEEEYDRL